MLTDIEFPEVFIGLVSPVGVDTSDVSNNLSRLFSANGYRPIPIKVTDSYATLRSQISPKEQLSETSFFNRTRTYIAYGNQVRAAFDDDSILGVAAVSLVSRARQLSHREEQGKVEGLPLYQRRAYIISQFKRPEEIELMRRVYGTLFFQISVYSRRESRVENIAKRISEKKQFGDGPNADELARKLVLQDEDEATDRHGQRVGAVFPDADFIVNTESTTTDVAQQVERFIELLFGSNTSSPTRDEYGLHSAKTAALRTLDLSRQVGAAIFSRHSEVLALGTNEVPKAGGGTYWADDHPIDAREYTLKADTNDAQKRLAVREMYGLIRQGAFDEDEFENFLRREDVRSSKMMDVIEYGRIVHAEMNAITDAARRGAPVKDATLYCTTFPCHICAKHIVASGIVRVVYLEPYPKSLAQTLHADSISVDGSPRGKYSEYPVVHFEHFSGVTPRRYREFFERGKRKDKSGTLQPYIGDRKRPNLKIVQPYYVQSEKLFIRDGYSALSVVAKHQSK